MKVLYTGSFFPADRFEEIWRNSSNVCLSTSVFQNSIVDGWRELGVEDVSVMTVPSIGRFPGGYRKIWFRRSTFDFNGRAAVCCGYFNLAVIKNVAIYLTAKREMRRWILNTEGEKVIVVGRMDYMMTAATLLKKRYPDVKVCLNLLDLPRFNNLKGIRRRLFDRLTQRYYSALKDVDAFILVSRSMIPELGAEERPVMIMEGIYNRKDADGLAIKRSDGKIILYTGALHTKYGIGVLLDAFSMIEGDDYELWLCGYGEAEGLIRERMAADKRIKYLGNLKHEEVIVLQRRAHILVNPRCPEQEFTRYSFPSKTIEYMASGRPVVMFDLEGVPEEYREFLALVEENSVEGLYRALYEWSEKSADELERFGRRARDFILTNKSAVRQAGRIRDFLLSL